MNKLLSALVALGIVALLSVLLLSGTVRQHLFSGRSLLGETFSKRNVRQNAPQQVEPGTRGLENSAANTVTSVVLDYRGFDTLGEVTVLFAAVAGAGLILFARRRREGMQTNKTPSSLILRAAAPWVFLFLFVTGFVIILHGHLTPGGGFPGGAMVAAGLVLLMAALDHRPSGRRIHTIEALAGFAFVMVGVAGVVLRGSFLLHFTDMGALGDFLSAPITLFLYLVIGLKVSAEITNAVSTLEHAQDNGEKEAP